MLVNSLRAYLKQLPLSYMLIRFIYLRYTEAENDKVKFLIEFIITLITFPT